MSFYDLTDNRGHCHMYYNHIVLRNLVEITLSEQCFKIKKVTTAFDTCKYYVKNKFKYLKQCQDIQYVYSCFCIL